MIETKYTYLQAFGEEILFLEQWSNNTLIQIFPMWKKTRNQEIHFEEYKKHLPKFDTE